MVISLGRRLYNLSSRPSAALDVVRPDRPDGPLIWLHAPSSGGALGLQNLAMRLTEEDGFAVLLTTPDGQGFGPDGPIIQAPPPDNAADVRAFLDHWSPDLAMIAEGEVRPALMFEAQIRALPVLFADARQPFLIRGREGWYPGLMRGSLANVQHVAALDEPAARLFRKAGARSVDVSGRLEEQSAALPCHDGEREALAELFATRPVWLAADLPVAEEAAVIAAHRSALRLSHRLLLIVVPQDPARASDLAAQMQEVEGWHVAQRALEEDPDPEVEVYVPDGAAEYGLWYRLAPVTFLGGSLFGDGAARNPMEPAALGSAILHGPRPGGFGDAFGRLGAARAARAVGSASDLADALSDLLSPDRSARYAAAAWGVASDGTEVTENALARVRAAVAAGR